MLHQVLLTYVRLIDQVQFDKIRPFAKSAPVKSAPKIKHPGQLGPQEKKYLSQIGPLVISKKIY